jgi:ketosteroid isomerase-like protein
VTQPNQELVQAASAAFSRGDLSTLQDQYFAQNIVWHVTGTGPLAGDYEGVGQVISQLGKISALAGGTIRPQLHDVLVSSDHTVVLATVTAERAGRQLQLSLVHVIHAENGKATEMWTHSTDPAGAASFWS